MKLTRIKDSDNKLVITLEEPDDLFSLRRVIEVGDNITADTTRVIKQDSEFSRPDKGERVKIRIILRVEKISFDDAIDRLKVSGIIITSNNENIPRGLHHSITVKISDTVTLEKARWNENYMKILSKSTIKFKYLLVSIDSQEASIASLTGTYLKTTPNIYSGRSGKRYSADKKNETNNSYFESVRTGMDIYLDEQGIKIIVFGPGETKRRFYNFLKERNEFYQRADFNIVEGIEASGEDGIFVFLRSQAMKDSMSNSKIAMVANILDKIMQQISKGEKRYAMGIKEIRYAQSLNAIEAMVYSDKVFAEIAEEDFIKLLNDIEYNNTKVFATDSTTDMGLRVSSLGGVIALLRYPIY
ncbi:mRNA surveillance protein pelota [Candidatus Nitrosocosmicus hydrocola]|jgi:protein pelota|uniref:mRNA surveillance protein pelota n=1 Tax=Candidatus Nitrosocosmicus hydrocola TaxID=1826872 RepID=UPI0011E5F406|nr:mRNA surveillance protein pelota [Candidatus Nitrosocosmicus hydrocola]